MYPHMHLIHVNLSRELDMAYASALSVDRTTLPICLVCHTIGEKSVVSFWDSFGVHAIMKIPCCADHCLADAKLGRMVWVVRYGSYDYSCVGKLLNFFQHSIGIQKGLDSGLGDPLLQMGHFGRDVWPGMHGCVLQTPTDPSQLA